MPNGSASRPAQPPPVDPGVPSAARVWNVWPPRSAAWSATSGSAGSR